jgi:hypothetical protein
MMEGKQRRRFLRDCIGGEESSDDKNPSLSLSLTWAELAAQSRREQASSAAEAAAWERVIENAKRGSLGGAEKRKLRRFSFLPTSLEKKECLSFPFLSGTLLPSLHDLLFFSSSKSSSFLSPTLPLACRQPSCSTEL